ncbi:protein kinase domain-containing protein [Nocardia asteroides]|uniref:protein kinase domain-containing protein n=1 Tax=Nocardia asteroides TaxID=1824 RepID=UPI001E63222C|nr:peptidylprolyl isomerase [Nocardia asteroides]UGT60875.1 peptidylprolyl isomerase [Nocardia asteroides]
MLRPGEVFAGFRIEGELGRGGMGSVYLARHPRLPRSVALKVLSGELAADAEGRARFDREGDLVARLEHPNIVTVYDRGIAEGRPWLAMRYVDGVDAAQICPTELTLRQATLIATEAAHALDYAHAAGVLHRDVKPANLLIARPVPGRGHQTLLTDFGIARLRDNAPGLTRTGTVLATLAYAAPEQLGGTPLDGRADQYSLACTLYWLLTGTTPFEADTAGAVIAGHLHEAPQPPSGRRAGIPPELDRVLLKGLAKHPGERFGSCLELTRAAVVSIETTAAVAPPVAFPPAPVAFSPAPVVFPSAPNPVRVAARRAGRFRLTRGGVVATLVAAVTITLALPLWLLSLYSATGGASRAGTTSSSSTPPPPPATVDCTYRENGTASAHPVHTPETVQGVRATGTTSATMLTNYGRIGITLRNAESPCTVNSFVSLVQQGYFDDSGCHRLTATFGLNILQCGDPTGTGSGGPGYSFDDEYPVTTAATSYRDYIDYPRGTVAMAKFGTGANGSQFFFAHGSTWQPPEYTIFGSIDEEGMSTLRSIVAAGHDYSRSADDGSPRQPVVIDSVTVN